MFSTNVINERAENNKKTNCFMKIFIRKPISLPFKGIHVILTGSSGSVSTSIKSAEHMAKINTKIICLRSGAFPNFSWKLYQKYIKRLWNIYKYINFLSSSGGLLRAGHRANWPAVNTTLPGCFTSQRTSFYYKERSKTV